MKKLFFYELSEEQMADTRYRENQWDRAGVVTEDDWSLYDIWANQCGWWEDFDECEKCVETSDGLIIWKFTQHEDMYDKTSDVIQTAYLVEDTDAAREATEDELEEIEHYF